MKKYKVIYSPHALTDLEDAVYYYNEQQKGLGKRFVAQVQLALKSIKNNHTLPPFVMRMCAAPRCLSSPTSCITPSTKIHAPSSLPQFTAPINNHLANNVLQLAL